MTDQAPLDATVVARILRRAGEIELAADTYDGVGRIAEAALIAAAEEVGLSVDAVRRSIAIERLGPLPRARLGDRILGPAQVCAEGETAVPAEDALVRVDSWLVDGHHLRRDVLHSGHGEWSKRSGLMGATVRTIRNATGEGRLGDVERVSVAARDTGSGTSMVRVTVDRTARRRLANGGSAIAAVAGTTGVVVAAVAAAPVALLAMPAAVATGVGLALTGRKRARATEHEIRRLLASVDAGVEPTRLSVDVARRASGRATATGRPALRAAGRPALPPPAPRSVPAVLPRARPSIRRRGSDG